MSERRACARTFETPDVIATCLLDVGHGGPHDDYANGLRWVEPSTSVNLLDPFTPPNS